VAAVLAAAGCASDGSAPAPGAAPSGEGAGERAAPVKPRVRRARCAAGVPDCVAVTGRVLYVEAVDPDGDGDAHYVLAGGRVTAPGLSAIDVAPALRPRRLPRPGDLVSAAGPVRTGSYGQRQIEATVVHHERP
jgi:hypothetical protein